MKNQPSKKNMGKRRKLLPRARQKAKLQKMWLKAINFEPPPFTFENAKTVLRVARSFIKRKNCKHFRMSRTKTLELVKHGGDMIWTKKHLRKLLTSAKTGPEMARVVLATFPQEMEEERESLTIQQQALEKRKQNQLILLREPFLGQWSLPVQKYCGYQREWSDVNAKIMSLTSHSVVIKEEISREEHRLSFVSRIVGTTLAEGRGPYCKTRIINRDACHRLIELTKALAQSITSSDLQSLIREYTLP